MLRDGERTKWRRNIAENFISLSRVHERYRRQTTDTRTGDIGSTYSSPLAAVSCLCRVTAVRCSVVGSGLFCGRPGGLELDTIRGVLLTVFVVT